MFFMSLYPRSSTLLRSFFANAFFLLVSSVIAGCSQGDNDDSSELFKKTSLYDGKLEVSIPSEFQPMGEQGLAIKYPNAAQKPDVAYASDYGKVTMIFVLKDKPTTSNDIPAIKSTIDRKMGQAEAYHSNVKTINGHQYVVSEFKSGSETGKNYNMMIMTDFQGKLLLTTINFPVDKEDLWLPKANEILASLDKK
jgi:hypothetical protein